MTKFAIRSISELTMRLPEHNQYRYLCKHWNMLGAPLVNPVDVDLLTFKTQKAAQAFCDDVAKNGFRDIRVQQVS